MLVIRTLVFQKGKPRNGKEIHGIVVGIVYILFLFLIGNILDVKKVLWHLRRN